jgi:hypothetical protein
VPEPTLIQAQFELSWLRFAVNQPPEFRLYQTVGVAQPDTFFAARRIGVLGTDSFDVKKIL